MTSTFLAARSLTASLVRSFVFGALVLTGAACSGDADEGTGQTADEFAAESKLTFVDCGSLTFGNPAPTCTGPSAEVACLQAHMADCTPARLRQTFTSDEGAPIVHDYLVVPGKECAVQVFSDNRADSYAAHRSVSQQGYGVSCVGTQEVNGCESVQPICPIM